MNKVYTYNVFDLGRCNLQEKDSSLLSIPKLQRGQVWKPRQVELLWDSLLRNFPIGTIIVLSDELEQDSPKGELLDGQQRVSAIITGFKEVSPDTDSIVWVDLNAKDLQDRKYAIRVTNRAHPWGYSLNGDVLNAGQRREAIKKARELPGSSKLTWNILNFGPSGANVLPVPFVFFLNASGDDKNADIIGKCEALAQLAPVWGERYLDKVKNADKAVFAQYLDAIRRLKDNQYRIPAIVIDTKDDLDILFSRIGVQGTAITNKELAYALMKSYWDREDFGPINKKVSEGLVSEEDFAQIVFRLYASRANLRGEILPEFVRGLQRSQDSEKAAICKDILDAYSDDGKVLKNLTSTVKTWILACTDGDRQFHPIIVTEIANKKPSLYILLLKLAQLKEQGKTSLSDAYIQALAFYLYTCLLNDKTIGWLYSCIVQCKDLITEEFISNLIRDALSFSCEWALPIVESFVGYPALNVEAFDTEWSFERYNNTPGSSLFERLFRYGRDESAFILKLAEHNFFNTQYRDYNPSRKDLWEDLNRPWDHDHIVPQNWIGENQDWSSFCNKWINCIGNIADIPFELNRMKQDDADWTYYCEHADELLFTPTEQVLALNEHLSEPGNDSQRMVFFNFVRERFLKITEPFLKILSNLHLYDKLSDNQLLRKRIMLAVVEKHPECKLYFYNNGIEYPFEPNNNYAWQQVWLTVSKEINDSERCAALTIAIDDDNKFEAECGLRKRPELYVEQMSNRDWWKSIVRGKVRTEDCDGELRVLSYHGWNPIKEFDNLLYKYRS